MHKKKYDIVFLMNHYGFYKTNLYNEIAKKKKILIIYLGESSLIRNEDFYKGERNFDYVVLNCGPYEKRNKIKSCWHLFKYLRKISYSLIVTMSWSTPEDIMVAFTSKKDKNGLVCESSIYESETTGIKGWIKKAVVKRHHYAFVSGTPHIDLFRALNFRGKVIVTGGVGVINKSPILPKEPNKNADLRYLTIARLSPEKNLNLLIETFNYLKKPLTIVGSGPLEKELMQLADENIRFIDKVDNKKLNELYAKNDVFVLPSITEPWGLVIDEALYFGVPVIVSDRVGCRVDLVEELKTGLVFQFDEQQDLINKIHIIEDNYDEFSNAVHQLDFQELIERQIQSFIDLPDEVL